LGSFFHDAELRYCRTTPRLLQATRYCAQRFVQVALLDTCPAIGGPRQPVSNNGVFRPLSETAQLPDCRPTGRKLKGNLPKGGFWTTSNANYDCSVVEQRRAVAPEAGNRISLLPGEDNDQARLDSRPREKVEDAGRFVCRLARRVWLYCR